MLELENNISTRENDLSEEDPASFGSHTPIRDTSIRGNSKKAGIRSPILVLVACVVASGMFGFAGGLVSNQVIGNQTETELSAALVTQTEILYQSVIRTVASGDASVNEAMTVVEAAAAVKETVVEITTETVTTNGRMGQLITEGAGSGVIISSEGYIVTNNHVVSGANSITARLSDGTEYSAALVGTDAKSDLAVLKIDAADLTPAIFGDSSKLMVGETLVAIGNPLGELGGTVTSGILSALDREITIDGESMRLIQTDTAINPGNSGGGLFNLYGELIGIVNAKSSGSDVEGLGFAIPIDTAKLVIESIIEYGYVHGRIDPGFTIIDLSNAQTAMMYRVNKTGLYIYESRNSELKSGDRITAVDGLEITGQASYNAAMESHSVGDTVQITVVRGNQGIVVSITLGELKG